MFQLKNIIMKKFTISLILTISGTLIISSCFAQYTLQDNDIVVENGVITSCNIDFDDEYDILIPDTLHGQAIIAIRDAAKEKDGVFAKKKIRSVKFSGTMQKIGSYAFCNNKIQEIDFENSTGLMHIGAFAFANNYLEEVDLYFCKKIEHIDNLAFAGNNIYNIVLDSDIIRLIVEGGDFYGNETYELNFDYFDFKNNNIYISDTRYLPCRSGFYNNTNVALLYEGTFNLTNSNNDDILLSGGEIDMLYNIYFPAERNTAFGFGIGPAIMFNGGNNIDFDSGLPFPDSVRSYSLSKTGFQIRGIANYYFKQTKSIRYFARGGIQYNYYFSADINGSFDSNDTHFTFSRKCNDYNKHDLGILGKVGFESFNYLELSLVGKYYFIKDEIYDKNIFSLGLSVTFRF